MAETRRRARAVLGAWLVGGVGICLPVAIGAQAPIGAISTVRYPDITLTPPGPTTEGEPIRITATIPDLAQLDVPIEYAVVGGLDLVAGPGPYRATIARGQSRVTLEIPTRSDPGVQNGRGVTVIAAPRSLTNAAQLRRTMARIADAPPPPAPPPALPPVPQPAPKPIPPAPDPPPPVPIPLPPAPPPQPPPVPQPPIDVPPTDTPADRGRGSDGSDSASEDATDAAVATTSAGPDDGPDDPQGGGGSWLGPVAAILAFIAALAGSALALLRVGARLSDEQDEPTVSAPPIFETPELAVTARAHVGEATTAGTPQLDSKEDSDGAGA